MRALLLILPSLLGAAETFSYTLAQPGRVSLAIVGPDGQVVSELKWGETTPAGTHTVTWDGKDSAGTTVTNSQQCTWRLLRTPSGLHAEFLTSIGNTFPRGNQVWQRGLGNHVGPYSVLVDGGYLYAAAGEAGEGAGTHIKMTLDGSSLSWYGYSLGAPGGVVGQGYIARGIIDGVLYGLQPNGFISYHGANAANGLHISVGPDNGNDHIGRSFKALWGTTHGEEIGEAEPDMDMAAWKAPGQTGQVVVSYKGQNALRWYDPAVNGGPGTVLQTATGITAPTGLAIDNQGRVLVLSGSTLIRLDRGSPDVRRTVATGLGAAFRIAVDRTTNDVFVAHRGGNRQILRLRYNGSSDDYAVDAAFGRPGGRLDGAFVSTDFRNVTGIAADHQGGFIITESNPSPVRRVAHFSSTGSLIRQWFGAARWTPTVAVDPEDPRRVWAENSYQTLCLWELSAGFDQPQLRAAFSLRDVPGKFNSPLFIGTGGGTGLSSWRVLRRDGVTFFANDWDGTTIKLLRLDTQSVPWRVVPAVVADVRAAWIWTDADGDGNEDPGERTTYPATFISDENCLRPMHDFTYILTNSYRGSGSAVLRLRVASWNAIGNPVYEPIAGSALQPFARWSPDIQPSDADYFESIPTFQSLFAMDSVSQAVFAGANRWVPARHDWSQVDRARMIKWDAQGVRQWAVGGVAANNNYYDTWHTAAPGEIWSAFKSTVGVHRGTVLAADFNGGHNGRSDWTAFTYAWDQDGLWVGNAFEAANCDLGKGPLWLYTHSSENGSHAVWSDPATGHLYWYAGHESEQVAFRITGWDGWERQRGKVSTGHPDSTPPATPEAPTLRSGGAWPVLAGTTEPGALVRIRVDGTERDAVTADSTGAWVWRAVPGLPAGTRTVAVAAQDAAGNISTGSPTLAVVVGSPNAGPVITVPAAAAAPGLALP